MSFTLQKDNRISGFLFNKKLFLFFNNILTVTQLLEEKGCSFHCYLTDFS